VERDPQNPQTVVAAWAARDQTFLNGHFERLTLLVTASSPVPPILERTQEMQTIPIGRRGVQVAIRLPYRTTLLRFRVLLLADPPTRSPHHRPQM